VDNLPNTVIESLLLGTPVIGSRGASIDELVVDEVSGLLVEIENPRALADAMVRVWRRDIQWTRGALPLSQTMEEMQPERAVTAMLELGARVGMRGVLA
jgi:glycosyltransferase involved in cell wall biosynthesis